MNTPEETINLDNLGGRARVAIGWQFLAKGITTGMQIITGIILARLLMPEDFGILAMAMMVTGLAMIFQDLGLGQALVQRKDLQPVQITSAFWGTLLMGASLCGLIVIVAPYVGAFFKEPRMTPVLQVMAFTFLISPFGVIPRSLLQRELDFKRPFFAGLISSAIYAAVGITMALTGYSYWSLVAALLASSAAGTIAICVITRYLPPLVPSLRGVKDLCSFGVGVTGVGLFAYIATKVDYFVIGHWLDATALGLYTRAYSLVAYPLNMTSQTIYPVLFPAFSQMQDDLPRLRHAFSRVLTALTMLSFPALALLGVTAPELIPVVLGRQWQGAVLPTQIMVAIGFIMTIGNPGGASIKAVGLVYRELWLQVVRCALLACAAWIGARWGIIGVAWAVLAAWGVLLPLTSIVVYTCIGFGVTDYVWALRGPVFMALCTFAAAGGCRIATGAYSNSATTILLVTAVAGGSAAIMAAIYNPFGETQRTIEEVVNSSRRLLSGGRNT